MKRGLALLMVGDELLDGRSQDTNSQWIIGRAGVEGWQVETVEVLPDRVEDIAAAIRRHAGQVAAIVVSGGLGPTVDDLTRDGLAEATGRSLEFDPEILRQVESVFLVRNRPMPANNERQAWRTPESTVLPNPVGTAVGLLQEFQGSLVALLPGVPAELKAMFDDHLRPRLVPVLEGGRPPSTRLRTTGIAESRLIELVARSVANPDALDLAYCVSMWGVDLVVRGADAAAAVGKLRSGLRDFVFGEGEDSLPGVVIAGLGASGQTLSVAESCTGGLVGGALTSVPGSSAVFRGGVVAYENAVKEQVLGVDPGLLEAHGAVSEEVAAAMALGARSVIGSDWAVATTGVAGPDGGTDLKPVGTVCLGLAGPDGRVSACTRRYGGNRDLIRRWATATALDSLRRGRLDRD